MPLVLHGGSGIPNEQIQKAVSLGVAKINVNTELQLEFAAALKEFVKGGKIDEGKNFDPRKIMAAGMVGMRKELNNKIDMFGSRNKG
jgi:fructose-bisphosphate aldolase class II